jgi:gluconate 5-dehydrogenase
MNDLFSLAGKVALVTGGSRGLGLEIAEGLGEAGAAVAVTARREQWLGDAEKGLRAAGIDATAMICDVSDQTQVMTTVAAVRERWGRIDVLVNNAGISWGAPAETMPLEKWRAVMETNATGTFLMSQAVGIEMIRAGRGGSIINVASVAGVVGSAPEMLDAIGYSASKGAIIAFTRDLAVKWARHQIRVNAIAPGYFPTRLSSGVLEKGQSLIEQATPMARVGRPGELKGIAIFLAATASAYVTGHVVEVDGGMTAW